VIAANGEKGRETLSSSFASEEIRFQKRLQGLPNGKQAYS
jgi:hypothetical protein